MISMLLQTRAQCLFRVNGRPWTAVLIGLGILGALPGALPAASIESDLGDELRYHRVQELPQDLPAPTAKATTLILDLRYVAGGDDDAKALQAWLKFRSAAVTPVLVIVNAGTSPALLQAVATNQSETNLVTVGPAGPDFRPDILVTISPEAEQKAYDALAQGTAITALLSENAGKTRLDEAAIMRDRSKLPEDSVAADDDEFFLGDDEKPAAPRAEPTPIDVALQRAVHVHRALRALKRI